jgi:oxygen-independent coproporphyrinogen-3 oxidase
LLYIHFPFCKQACSYCDFHFSTSTRYKSDLVNALLKEIEIRKDELQNPLQSVYLGGGTPSLLDASELASILELVNAQWGIEPHAEITLEANPDDLTFEKLQELKSLGINRLSIGVQSFFQEDLTFMNRAHSSTEALQCIELAAQTGFDRLSIDLIYGTPGLSDARWIENLQKAAYLPVNHLSCYALTVEPKTALHSYIQKGQMPPLDEALAAEHGLEAFGSAGFHKKLLQKAQGFFGDAVLGVVEKEEVVQADGLRRNAGGIREEVAQMQIEGGGMGLKGLPGAGFRRIHGILKKT